MFPTREGEAWYKIAPLEKVGLLEGRRRRRRWGESGKSNLEVPKQFFFHLICKLTKVPFERDKMYGTILSERQTGPPKK